jgi:hypothetical protein
VRAWRNPLVGMKMDGRQSDPSMEQERASGVMSRNSDDEHELQGGGGSVLAGLLSPNSNLG